MNHFVVKHPVVDSVVHIAVQEEEVGDFRSSPLPLSLSSFPPSFPPLSPLRAKCLIQPGDFPSFFFRKAVKRL